MRVLIDVDISNIWGNIEFHSLIQMENRLSEAERVLRKQNDTVEFGWYQLIHHADEVFSEVAETVACIKNDSCAMVVIASGMVNQYLRSAIQYGRSSAADGMNIYFAGDSFSAEALQQTMSEVQKTDFSVLVIGRITTLEQAISLRQFKWLLYRKYGPDSALGRIYIASDSEKLQIRKLSQNCNPNQYIALGTEDRNLPAAACMIPIAAAGLNPSIVVEGVKRAASDLQNPDMENPTWLYAAGRVLLCEHGEDIEEFHIRASALHSFGNWCCQLFTEAACSCKNPITAILNPYTGYFYRKHTFETVLEVEEQAGDAEIQLDLQDEDGLNYLAGKRLRELESCAAEELSKVKAENHFPSLVIRTTGHTLRLFGYLTYFFQYTSVLSCLMLQNDQTEQRGTAALREKILEAVEQKYKS